MGWGIKGLESYHKQIEKLDKIADDLGKATSVDLLTTEFMKTYTNFSSFTELLDNGGYTINSNEDFQNILGDEFDIYISKVTKFKTWNEMSEAAQNVYIANKLKS